MPTQLNQKGAFMTEQANKGGSAYENYNKSHENYDLTRLPVGAEQVLAMLAELGYGNSPFQLLDAGCGTGMHLEFFHRQAPNCLLTGLDASSLGIEKAAQKLPRSVKLMVGDCRKMPLEDASVDVVLFSFMIHHLPHQSESELVEATAGLIAEAGRVLKPGGHIVIISTSKEQLHPRRGSLWYYRYFQDAAKALMRKFLPLSKLKQILSEKGFAVEASRKVDKTYWTAASLDLEGPFKQEWRDGDSLFAFYRGAQGEEVLQKRLRSLRNKIESGEAQQHIEETKTRVEAVKQAYILIARRS